MENKNGFLESLTKPSADSLKALVEQFGCRYEAVLDEFHEPADDRESPYGLYWIFVDVYIQHRRLFAQMELAAFRAQKPELYWVPSVAEGPEPIALYRNTSCQMSDSASSKFDWVYSFGLNRSPQEDQNLAELARHLINAVWWDDIFCDIERQFVQIEAVYSYCA